QHVLEDLGRIPTVQDWLSCLTPQPWMLRVAVKSEDVNTDQPRCECEAPGHFYCGVPGILAHLENGRLAAGSKVERCDICQRYPTDDAARQKLSELGLA